MDPVTEAAGAGLRQKARHDGCGAVTKSFRHGRNPAETPVRGSGKTCSD